MSADGLDMKDLRKRMDGAITALKSEFGGLRTGRATASLVEPIDVDAYGSKMPMNQVGTIGVPEPRMITIQVWDKGLVSAVEKAVRESGLGINPVVDGQNVRIPIPPLTEERRAELAKVAAKYAEQAKVAI
ncbi:MAG: ribosome-recycling factor, partial [Hyphococcus sp.]